MKLLFISNIIGKRVGSFAMASIKASQKLGIEYHMAANFKNSTPEQMKKDEEEYGITLHHIDFERSPFKSANRKAYKQIIELINREHFDAIHCNTPIGGLVGRLAGKKCKVQTVIYQAHGFHFYKGAPIRNWMLYYPVERYLARMSDAIITINEEDYKRAKHFKLRNNGHVYYVPGVGIDPTVFDPNGIEFDRETKRIDLGITHEDIMVISAGDLIKRKNYRTSIMAVKKADNPRIHYFICGKGPLEDDLKELVRKLGIESQVHFLGYRTDVKELLWASDVFLFTTLQEGLPRSLSEAMASGLPCVVSKIRGNTDLMSEGENGYLFEPTDCDGFGKALSKLSVDKDLRCNMSRISRTRIKGFDFSTVGDAVCRVYENELLSGNRER